MGAKSLASIPGSTTQMYITVLKASGSNLTCTLRHVEWVLGFGLASHGCRIAMCWGVHVNSNRLHQALCHWASGGLGWSSSSR